MATQIIVQVETSPIIAAAGVQVIAGPEGPPGASSAGGVSFNDTLAQLGVTNVQDAIVALKALIDAIETGGPGPGSDPGAMDGSDPDQSGLLAAST